MTATAGDAMELHRLEVARPGVLPFAIGSFDTIGPLARADFPHRHSFYEIALVTRGRGAHVLDLVRHELTPPYLYAMAPGQVHHWQDARDVAGWVVLFDEDFLLAHPGDAGLVHALSARRCPRPDAAEAAALVGLLAEMDREYRAAGYGYIGVLSSYLHILLLRALRMAGGRVEGPAAGGAAAAGRAGDVADGFRRLIARGGPRVWSVEACAAELGVSVSHLHDVVKRGTGRAPGRLIRAAQVLEAKRLIAGTDLTIRQVAARTGFTDPAYFCRFFRRETGVSPGEFRRVVGEKHHEAASGSIEEREESA
jgi:AraC-like DNA-binding protein